MSGMLFVRAMEMMMPIENDNEKCPKCGREGCTCDPDTCECGEPSVVDQQEDLIQDFEE